MILDQYLDGVSHSMGGQASDRSLVGPGSSPSTHASPSSDRTSVASGICSFLPQHSPVTCPLDQILLDFLSSRRAMASSGVSMERILGPKNPSIAAIINTELRPTAHPLSRVMAEVLATFPGVAVPEIISFMYLMHRTMRVSPSFRSRTHQR